MELGVMPEGEHNYCGFLEACLKQDMTFPSIVLISFPCHFSFLTMRFGLIYSIYPMNFLGDRL